MGRGNGPEGGDAPARTRLKAFVRLRPVEEEHKEVRNPCKPVI